MSNGMAVLIGAVIDFEYDTGARLSNRSNAPRRFEGEASESGSTADREGTYVTEEETIVASSPPVALSGHGSREETDGDGVLGLGDDNDRPDKGYEGLEDDESQAHDSLTEPPGLVGHELEKSCEREVEQLRSEIQGHGVEGSDARNGVEGGDVAAVFRGEMKAAQLERLLESWQGRCSICMIRGQDDSGHGSWKECGKGEMRRAVEDRWRMLGQVRCQFSACAQCHAPQAVCETWEAQTKGGRRRYRRKGGVQCQFPTVLRDMAAGLWAAADGGSGVGEWLEGELEAGRRHGGGEGDRRAGVMAWFGRRFVEGEMEVSGLCRMVWRFGPVV